MTDNKNIQQRYDTAANFAASNRVLLAGEKAIESDTLKEEVGNGTTAYNDLPYSTAWTIMQKMPVFHRHLPIQENSTFLQAITLILTYLRIIRTWLRATRFSA